MANNHGLAFAYGYEVRDGHFRTYKMFEDTAAPAAAYG
jgi:hypothetical protein